jgi:hypothetical protein
MTAVKPVFTDTYLNFTNQYFNSIVEEDDELKIPEKVIRCIWNDQLFKKQNLETPEGENLEVLFPGYWNFGPGPDFKSAAIKISGKLYEGDVELHVYGSDWKSHKHSENSEYDNVILHVFMWKNRRKIQSPPSVKKTNASPRVAGEYIFELEIKNFLKKGILKLNNELDFDNYPILNKFNHGLCHKPLSNLSKTKLEILLNAAGDARIHTKMDRYHDKIISAGYEQTFYEGLAGALGYPNNKKPFQELAERLPIATIQKAISGIPEKDKFLTVQSMLLGCSGLIDFKTGNLKSLAAEDQTYFDKIQNYWNRYRDLISGSQLSEKQWTFGGIRPANYPYRRIAGLSNLIIQHNSQGIFADFLKFLQSAILIPDDKGYNQPTKKSFDFFCVGAKGYWSRHYILGGKELTNPQKLIGNDRSREITVNICIPLGIIYARASRSVPLETALGLLFKAEKKPTDNKLLRFMKHYLLGNKKNMVDLLNNDKKTQGMMQVYQDFCTKNENNCLRCQFPGVVEKYFS